jgi:MFS family permease
MGRAASGLVGRVYYGWVMVGTLALTETVSWGILYYAFSVFLLPMRRELGWSEATLTGAYSLALLVSGLAAPFVGRWIDRRGPRWLMTAGSVLGVLLLLAWSRADDIVAWYLIWAGMGLAMAMTLYDPAFTALTAWFERQRARAFLLVTVAAGFASTIFLPVSGWLVHGLGWREALVVLAGMLAVAAALPHALLLRRRPADLGLRVDGVAAGDPQAHRADAPPAGANLREALRDRAFWWLALAFSFETLSTVAVGVHLVAYLTERGDGARFAAAATGLIGATQVLARILATAFGQRLSQVALTGLVFGLQAVALVMLLNWQTRAGVLTAVLLLGMGRGVVTLMRAGLVAEFYGRRHYGVINGTLALLLTAARAIAPVGAGAAYVLADSYRPVFWGLATISLLGAGAMLGVSRQRRASASPTWVASA